jgi:hypothetical protein
VTSATATGVCHTDTVLRGIGVSKKEEHGSEVSENTELRRMFRPRQGGSDRKLGENWIMRI